MGIEIWSSKKEIWFLFNCENLSTVNDSFFPIFYFVNLRLLHEYEKDLIIHCSWSQLKHLSFEKSKIEKPFERENFAESF
jgi:hypothetical protein